MATSLLVLLDDIATVLDDISVLTKVAAKKGAGVLGDDLALNAQQVSGVRASRELPVVWGVAKGSLLNKAILVPAALLIGGIAPWAIAPLLIVGGAFLCYEGVEKIAHKLLHRKDASADAPVAEPAAPVDEAAEVDLSQIEGLPEGYTLHHVAAEKTKIRGAVRTDFVLSAEIVVIALGTVADEPFLTQLGVLVAIALLMTVGVYGLVAGIVKIDDLGLALSRRANAVSQAIGRIILAIAPWFMRGLSIVGTAAMFLVGGGILVHGVGPLHHWREAITESLGSVGGTLAGIVYDGVVGIILGAVVLGVVLGIKRVVAKD